MLPATASFCCTASPGAPGVGTRCTCVTKAAGNTSAIICAPTTDCPPASTYGPHTWTPPAELDALSRAHRVQNQVDTALRTSAERQIERKRYAAALAERQFNRVDPDNRLVAAELERRWEAALQEVRAAEAALAEQSAGRPASQGATGKELTGKVVALAGRLPRIWADTGTTDAQRKALLRCLVEKVVLDRGMRDIAPVRIVWRGGAVTDLDVKMRMNSISNLARGDEMRARLLDLARAGMPDDEIATVLTGEGHRSPNRVDEVLPVTVQRIRLAAGIKAAARRNRWGHDTSTLSATDIATKLGIPVNWLYVDQAKAPADRSSADRSLSVPELSFRAGCGPRPSRSHHHQPRFENLSASPGGASTWVIVGGDRLAAPVLGPRRRAVLPDYPADSAR